MSKYTTIRGSKGKYPYHEGKHLIVAIELFAYGDESGLQAAPRYCFLCGFIASVRQWKLFNESWNKILITYNVPDFHARDFFARDTTGKRVKHYKDWSDKKAQSFIESLLNVVKTRRIYPIGGAVDVADFKANPEGIQRYLTGGAITKSGTTVHFVFDRQNVLEEQTIRTFHTIIAYSNPPSWNRLGNIVYSDRSHEPGLQVADLYTYTWQSRVIKGFEKVDPLVRQAYDSTEKSLCQVYYCP